MQKITQPDLSDKALDVAVQPLTDAEIQQVSGGLGTNRVMSYAKPVVSSAAPRTPALAGRSVYGS